MGERTIVIQYENNEDIELVKKFIERVVELEIIAESNAPTLPKE